MHVDAVELADAGVPRDHIEVHGAGVAGDICRRRRYRTVSAWQAFRNISWNAARCRVTEAPAAGSRPSQIVGLSLSGRGLPAGSHLRIRIGSRPSSAGARRAPGCEHSDDRGDAESAHIRLVDHDHGAGGRKAQQLRHGALESKPFPSSSFRAVASTTADATGHYSFKVAPSLNTTYHVVAKTSPPATSPDAIVKVRVSIGLHVSTSTPAIGKAVSFSGFVLPAYNGKTARSSGRRGPAGRPSRRRHSWPPRRWALSRSKHSKRLTIRSSGTYRVQFNPADGARIANTSPTRRLTAHH